MDTPLSPAKVVLLAVHFAAHADIDSLSAVVSTYPLVLRKDLVLRVLLTHLPETTEPDAYRGLLQGLETEDVQLPNDALVDTSSVEAISDNDASRRVKKLRLLTLTDLGTPPQSSDDHLTLFLFQRAYRIDEEAGLLSQLPTLLLPFGHHDPSLQAWITSAVLPLYRRACQYYKDPARTYTLRNFDNLPGATAVQYLLARTGEDEEGLQYVGRDLRGLISPWLQNEARWSIKDINNSQDSVGGESIVCSDWELVLDWLIAQASTSWKTALAAFEQYDGPVDVDFGPNIDAIQRQDRQDYLRRTYAQSAMASLFLLAEPSEAALQRALRVVSKVWSMIGEAHPQELPGVAQTLPDLSSVDTLIDSTSTTFSMRNDLLSPANPLTVPGTTNTRLLHALASSALIATRLGLAWTIRKAGELALLQDAHDQKTELAKLTRTLSSSASRDDDNFWTRSRQEVLWLRDWKEQSSNRPQSDGCGVFGRIPRNDIDKEILRTLLLNGRYSLARTTYDQADEPLPADPIEDVVSHCALTAFDNSTNPNRTRGGLKKCDEIIQSLPKSFSKNLPARRRVEALLKATHGLSEYRLVLKQGELFSPVVLRVHSDPISILEKVLEQNPRAYTRFQNFLEIGLNMARAGLPTNCDLAGTDVDEDLRTSLIEKRIVSMCIEAALAEDDFETAYSYVVSRLDASTPSQTADGVALDDWSWSAALKAGQYLRTERSQQPTHLGTASGNLEIRHLEQRMECLATALQVAPPCQLQSILKTFRRCEEQLDSAIQDEAAKEAAWDATGQTSGIPGAFDAPQDPITKAYPPRNITASATARQADEAPMSLFDLSRATARAAQRNLTALSSLQSVAAAAVTSEAQQPQSAADTDAQRVRKRDQFRDAATGTLVSGVGWLIGASGNSKEDR